MTTGLKVYDFDSIRPAKGAHKVGEKLLTRTEAEMEDILDRIRASSIPEGLRDSIARVYGPKITRILAFDTETDDYGFPNTTNVGMSLSWNGIDGTYIPMNHAEGMQLPEAYVMDMLRPFFEDDETLIIAHNMSYDFKVMLLSKVKIPEHTWSDTLLLSWMWDTECEHGLKPLTFRYFGHKMEELADFAPKKAHPIIPKRKVYLCSQVPIQSIKSYGAEDSIYCYKLFEMYFNPVMERHEKLYKDLELEFNYCLWEMEAFGVFIDDSVMDDLTEQLTKEVEKWETLLAEKYDGVNPNSTKQLNDLLFGKLGIKPIGKKSAKTGLYSTKGDYVDIWASQGHEVCVAINNIRELKKIRDTYTITLSKLAKMAPDGRIHGRLNRTGTKTSRLSGSEPNLQNIVNNDDFPVRKGFAVPPADQSVTGKERRFVVLDFSQIEYRVGAHITQDPEMIRVYREDKDLHSRTAKACWRLDVDEDDVAEMYPKYRKKAKVVNFGVFYEMGATSLADTINKGLKPGEEKITKEDAQQIIDNFNRDYANVPQWIAHMHRTGEQTGYVKTLLGHWRNVSHVALNPNTYTQRVRQPDGTEKVLKWGQLPADEKKRLMALKSKGYRQCSNTPVQGGAADVMAVAMRNIRRKFREHGWWGLAAMLVLTVHDEVSVECDADIADDVYAVMKYEMENAVKLRVPLKVEGNIATNWEDAK